MVNSLKLIRTWCGHSIQPFFPDPLRKTGKGSIITYKQLAENAGYPNAQQAVGQAMSKNYLLLFVPCHRVIANQGKLGGFSAGIELKQTLLKLEKANIERQGRIL